MSKLAFSTSPVMPGTVPPTTSSTCRNAVTRRRTRAANMNVQKVRTPGDFQAAIPSRRTDKGVEKAAVNAAGEKGHPLLVFSFVTANCRACSYARAGFERLAREFEDLMAKPSSNRHVRFFEVDISEVHNQQLGQRLGVDAVPAFQLYAFKNAMPDVGWKGGFGVLDELVGARVVGEVRKRLLHYSSDEFDLDEYVFDDGM